MKSIFLAQIKAFRVTLNSNSKKYKTFKQVVETYMYFKHMIQINNFYHFILTL
jgi:hypothetical protein